MIIIMISFAGPQLLLLRDIIFLVDLVDLLFSSFAVPRYHEAVSEVSTTPEPENPGSVEQLALLHQAYFLGLV